MLKGERINSISHLVGAVIGVAILVALSIAAAGQGDAWKSVSFAVYGSAFLLAYVFSTLYHALGGAAKRVLQKFDHASIYLFIAGTYTPFTLVTLRGTWGWTLFGVVWGLAALGITLDCSTRSERRIVPMLIYLAMGWSVLLAWSPLRAALPVAGIAGLVAGGAFYTIGALIFALEGRLRWAHEIWHFCVLAGSLCHFIVIWRFVV